MAPNATLASQFQKEFGQAYPDIQTALVTAETSAATPATRIVFGTSAVLFRDLGTFMLVVVDEQQSWSRSQREHYVSSSTHLIELSATCIPRTQALVRFGRVTVSQMRQCHAPKNILTRLWEGPEQTQRLMQGISKVVEQGRPVIVVYPKREDSDSEGNGSVAGRYSVEAALDRWQRRFPGRVRALTSDDDLQAKQSALADLESGRANILLCTTIIQCGVNIQGLRNMVVAHPDRHGITALHQLRGRLARQGGDGFFELLVVEPLSDKARARLDAVASTTDGFKLADLDLELRGTGDMGDNSDTQSGADQTFLFGVPMRVELLDDVRPLWSKLLTKRFDTVLSPP